MPLERITKRDGQGTAYIEKELLQEDVLGFSGEAAERLAKYEDVYAHLTNTQKELSAKLEDLRREGKTQSHQFKELMGKKLMNAMFISLLEARGLR